MNLLTQLIGLLRSKLAYKLSVAFLLIITSLGIFIYFVVNTIVTDTLYEQHRQRGISVASNLASHISDFLLVENISQIQLLLKNTQNNEHEIIYMFIIDSHERVVAHTFPGGFPKDLRKLHEWEGHQSHNEKLIATEQGILLDISVPILHGSLGDIHIGLSRETIDQRLNTIRQRIFYIFLLACVTAIILAVFISRRIARPITNLTNLSKTMADGNLDQQVDVGGKDEVGALARSFEHMRGSIQQTIQELQDENIKRRKVAKDLEEAYRIINNSKSVAFLWKNSEGSPVEFVSANVQDLFGYSAEEFISGKISYEQNILPEDRAKVKDEITLHSEKGGDIYFEHKPYRIVTKDNVAKWVSDKTYLRRDATGKVTHYQGIVEDITQRKMAEEEKANLEIQLRQSQKMEAIGTLAGGIAHDFNNILAIIIGNADFAKIVLSTDHPARDKIDKVINASNRAKDLVRQILSFSRQSEDKKEPFYLCRLVDESMKSIRSTIPTSVKTIINIPTKCRTNISDCKTILADPTQIHQLLINLCVNSVQAMSEQGVLEISVEEITYGDEIPFNRSELNPGTYEYLSVSDTGHGIQPEITEQIFNPFFTTKEVGKGTGMGLSVAHTIIESHKGKVFVESEPGKGTTFHIYFPVTDLEPELDSDDGEESTLPTGKERILFVDDEEMLVQIGKDMIESFGYEVTGSSDSLNAFEIFKNNPAHFDLVITDQTMPNLTGAELAEQMLAIKPDLPVILCTGYSGKVNKEKAREIGVRKFVAKPLSKNKIIKIIRQVLDENSTIEN